MKRTRFNPPHASAMFTCLMVLLSSIAQAQTTNPDTQSGTTLKEQADPAAQQAQKDKDYFKTLGKWRNRWWPRRHANKVKEAQRLGAKCELVFLGDSITQSWEGHGKNQWLRFKKYNPLNLGFSGDLTEHALWRINNGEWPASIQPKVTVLLIGTNDTGENKPPEDTAKNIKTIVHAIHHRAPQTKIILHPIFPRGATPNNPKRKLNNKINQLITPLADLEYVTMLDINHHFLDEEGNLPKSIMPDRLHPRQEGYKIWADSLTEQLKKWRIHKN